jgi:hypothetical protein
VNWGGLSIVGKDMDSTARKLDQIDAAATARINRRQTVMAQIEAALLADKLTVLEISEERTGTDPYNSYRPKAGAWSQQKR